MINFNMTLSQQAEFAMPISGSGLVAAVRALPIVGSGAAVSAAAESKHRVLDTTPVRGYVRNTDAVVVTGAFPGTSAWSPPI